MKELVYQLILKQKTITSIEELRENWNEEEIALYYANGRLIEWLNYYFYDELAEQIRNLEKVENVMPALKEILWEKNNINANAKIGVPSNGEKQIKSSKSYFEMAKENISAGKYNEAFEFSRKGACLGDGRALALAAALCQKGKGVEMDKHAIVSCYLGAVKLGCYEAMGELGDICMQDGYYARAAQWYQRAADRGDEYSIMKGFTSSEEE